MRKSSPRTKKRLAAEEEFRVLIWRLDGGRDRCTGRPLERSSGNWDRQGDVVHIKPKGRYPELKYSINNAFLMSRNLHIASDGRGNYRLKILGDDARQTLTFVMTDKFGRELWRRVG